MVKAANRTLRAMDRFNDIEREIAFSFPLIICRDEVMADDGTIDDVDME